MRTLPLVALHLLDWILVLVRQRRNFFVFYATNPISGIRARSMRRCFVRVEHNVVVGVDLLVATHPRVLWILRDSGMKRPGPTLLVRVRETGSALDM